MPARVQVRWCTREGVMYRSTSRVAVLAIFALGTVLAACNRDGVRETKPSPGDVALASSGALNDEGKTIFRYDTFGDESFWTDSARLHEVIRTSVSPKTALSVGLKVDAD